MKDVSTSIRGHVAGPVPEAGSAPSSLDCETSFQKIAKSCAHLVQGNRRSAIAADPEAIRAMRMELTRLRAAVLFFSPMVKDAAWPPIRKGLSWLNSALGKARDHDVTVNYTPRKRYHSRAKRSRRAVARVQEQAHRGLAKKLDSARYNRLIAELNHWIRRGSWLQNDQALRSERIDLYSQARLCRWRTEIGRKGRHLRTLRRKQLHRLRSQCKRYRYMVAAPQLLRVNLSEQDLAFGEAAKQVHRVLGDLRDLRRLRKTVQRRPPYYRKSKRKLLRQAEKAFRRAP